MEQIIEGLAWLDLHGYIPYVVTAHIWVAWIQAHWVIIMAGILALSIIMGMSLSHLSRPKQLPQGGVYGHAHFATKKDIRSHRLDGDVGTFVGRLHGVDVRVPRGHLVIIGASRSGKTITINMGDEIEWVGSVLTLDLKGQHALQTAEYRRRRGNLVHVFEPRYHSSGHINLLGYIPWGEEEEVQAIDRVTDHLTDLGTTHMSGGALFYRASNRRILKAVALYEGNYGAHQVVSFASIRASMGNMLTMLSSMAKVDHPEVVPLARELLGLPMPKRTELWNSARNCLDVFGDPILARNTDETTIDLMSLQYGSQPQTVYVRITPDDVHGPLRGFTRLLFDQHIATAGQRRDIHAFRWHERVNLDDQFELGQLAAADHIPAFYGEHGLWISSTFQSFSQLKDYGAYANILDNSRTWVVFPPNHTDSAKIISEKLGTTTVYEARKTRSTNRKQGTSTMIVPHKRELMTPFEVEHAPPFHAFVFTVGDPSVSHETQDRIPPMLVKTIPYTERKLG